ncbi:MAG: DeoR/GlpR family DNA-binding transcription regulator [Armatimonadota bacterium]
MLPQQLRHVEILKRLRDDQHVNIREMAIHLDVSQMTIRRDLAVLEGQGLLRRTFGGGIATDQLVAYQQLAPVPPTPTKAAIGALAASLVEPGQTVLIDAGTTTHEVARALPVDRGLTVVTNSFSAAQELLGTGQQILLLGGYLAHEDRRLFGPLTEENITHLHADIMFVGCVGASGSHGFYMSDLHLTSTVQAMIHASDRVVVVAESVKFRRRSLSCYATPEEVYAVVTDRGLPEEERRELEERGVQVLLADGD